MVDVAGNISTTATFESGDGSANPRFGTYSGLLETDNDVDWVAVHLNGGATYDVFAAIAGPFFGDSFIRIYDGTGTQVAFVDDGGSSLNSSIAFTPSATGLYYVAIRDFDGDVGEYSLFFTSSSMSEIALTRNADTRTAATMERLLGGEGNDILSAAGFFGGLMGEQGDDRLTGSNGGDELVGGTGNDIVNGRDGNDDIFGDAGADVLAGGEGEDDMFGGDGDDRMSGDGGDDELLGGAGNDRISGGAANDELSGGDGNDLLDAGTGSGDQLHGGSGNDTFILRQAGQVASELYASGTDTVQSTVSVNMSSAQVTGAVENLTLLGSAISGTGNGLANTIVGNAAANVLNGMGGHDKLSGGAGRDTLTGGTGNDTFAYRSIVESRGTTYDIIRDFDDSGNDRIDLSAVYGGKLKFIGDDAFTGAGQVHIRDLPGADVMVEVNTGGSLAADMAIRLTATTLASMTATDFVL